MPFPAPQSHLDVVAQHAGFPDYATWQAWNQHRTDAITQGSNTTTPASDAANSQPNFLMSLLTKIPLHPAAIMGYVSDRYHQATGF